MQLVKDEEPQPTGGLNQPPLSGPGKHQLKHHVARQQFLERASVLEGFGKGFLDWSEWRKDPARAAGNVTFSVASLIYGPKVLKALPVKTTTAAADTVETAGDTAEGAAESTAEDTAKGATDGDSAPGSLHE